MCSSTGFCCLVSDKFSCICDAYCDKLSIIYYSFCIHYTSCPGLTKLDMKGVLSSSHQGLCTIVYTLVVSRPGDHGPVNKRISRNIWSQHHNWRPIPYQVSIVIQREKVHLVQTCLLNLWSWSWSSENFGHFVRYQKHPVYLVYYLWIF